MPSWEALLPVDPFLPDIPVTMGMESSPKLSPPTLSLPPGFLRYPSWALLYPQTPHPEQLGPTVGSAEGLDLVSAKDLAGQLTDHDWNLFNSIHQVRGAELNGVGEGARPGVG